MIMSGKSHRDIARAGAREANKRRTPEQRRQLGIDGMGVRWKGHKKGFKKCACLGCKSVRRRKKKIKK